MEETNQRKAGAILSYISIIVSTLVQLLYTPLLIHKLGQSEYGLYSLVSSIIGYLTVLDLGFGNAIIVYTAKYRAQKKYDEEKKLHGMFFVIFCIIGAITTLLGLVLYFNVNLFFDNTMTDVELHETKIMMLILTFNLAITFPFTIYSSIISAYEKFTFQKVMSIVNTILKPVFMIPLLFLGFKSVAMCVVITIVNVIILMSNYLFCKNKLNIKIRFKGFDSKLFKTIFGYSFWVFLGVIVDKVNWSTDNFVLGSVAGTIEVSIYSVASQLNNLFINLSTAISGVFLPKMSKLVADKADSKEVSKEFIKIGRLQYYVIFLMCSGLILFGKTFIVKWAGSEFEESYYVALLLIIPICIPLIQNLGLSIMQAMNKYKFKSISTAIMAVFNVIISVCLARKFGAVGAAAGTAIALVICNIIIINIYYYKEIKLNIFEFWKQIIKMTLYFSIPIIVILGVMFVTRLEGIISFIVYGSIYTILFSATSYVFVMNEYEKNIFNSIFRKLKLVK